MAFDPDDEKMAPIIRRLRDDEVGWLVTAHEGTPRPVPIWFLWDGKDKLLVYSSPKSLKTKTAAKHPPSKAARSPSCTEAFFRMQASRQCSTMRRTSRSTRRRLKTHTEQVHSAPEAINEEYHIPLVMTIDRAQSW